MRRGGGDHDQTHVPRENGDVPGGGITITECGRLSVGSASIEDQKANCGTK